MPSDDYGLVMPFVTVSSEGGPHDDHAYVAGWEMGVLDAELHHTRPPLLSRVIHRDNTRQADLIAMKHGYISRITAYDDHWSYLYLTARGVT